MKKQKKSILIFILIIAIIIGAIIYYKNKGLPKNSQYEASRTSSENKTTDNTTESNNNNNDNDNNIEANNQTSDNSTNSSSDTSQQQPEANTETTPAPQEPQLTETKISTFSTKIYTKDSSRQNNITITCKSLNGTTVKAGETFSFTSTVGPATTAKGYQKADIYDKDGNKKKGLGGGNCQVSTTLYNAILACPSLKITERHEHSGNVPYITKGKDAAVAYGSYDLKFVNNSKNTIKILASNDSNSITISLLEVK